MRLTTRSRYGIKALLDLSLQPANQPVSVRQIATRQHIPAPYLEKLLISLRRAGIVESVRGVHGGYRLARSLRAISLGEVLEAVGETLLMFEDDPGRDRAEDWVMVGVRQQLNRKLSALLYQISLEELYYDVRSWQAAQGDRGNFMI